ncbi:hypothetical protein CGH81_15540 [Vibrio parahaemolyticus]|uniref:site-specific integrase n=1 Tax=Vibrio parahaemolyticus TaxID=670 RepID=UPI00111F6937|nr:site-specific integrase [Vibrio parahaemolyticus]EJE4172951.1 site-specific integrase [Vibrio parahaemolyticus]TOM26084.1 hypothetical protein CGH81_15540 [Vibrio parahaemolyticus]
MAIDKLKIDVKSVIKGDDSEELLDSCLYLYGNGDVNWFATDYLMSNCVPKGSKKNTKGFIRYFLEYLENYEFWKYGDIQGKPVPLGLVSDSHLLEYVNYIEDDIGLNRNAIANRVRTALFFLKFIQENYALDYTLLAIANLDGEFFDKGLVNAEWRINPYRNSKYLYHESIPHEENYGSRFPITEAAIESLYDDLDLLEESGQTYTYELFSTLIGLLENTGARVSEIANIDEHAIELLRLQVKAILAQKDVKLEDVISLNRLTIDVKSLKAAEAIYRKSSVSRDTGRVVWIKIKTTKGKNKNKLRIVPISFTVAQDVIKFYDEYIVSEKDRINKGLAPLNRAQFKKLFVHPSSHLPMTGSMISSLFYEIFTRKYKSKHKRNPHLFRHRFITLLTMQQLKALNASVGGTQLANLILKRIQGLTGHASVSTMLHYVELAEAELNPDIDDSSKVPFDDETREHLIAELGEDTVAALEAGIKLKKAQKAIVDSL